jgi:3-demethoxyubiquinol 3-hydroxylase
MYSIQFSKVAMASEKQFRVTSTSDRMLGFMCGFLATTSKSGAIASKVGVSHGLQEEERRISEGLMRVNHVGEVCAQALYESQALFAKSESQRNWMQKAGAEEKQHLAWTQTRLDQLGGRVSYLNPVWYGGAFAMGAVAAMMGDRASLSFVLETERQVEAHLEGHLSTLPTGDEASRAIVTKMQADEQRHADLAIEEGAEPLPALLRGAMQLSAKVMTTTAYYI